MFNMALLNSGFNIDEPTTFTGTLQRMVNVGFGLDRDEPIEEIEVEIDEEEEAAATETTEGTEADEEEIVIDGDSMTHTTKPVTNEDDGEEAASEEVHDDL